MLPPCLTLSNIRYISRAKWSNPGNEVAPSPTPQCSSYWKGSLLIVLNYGHQLYIHAYTLLMSILTPIYTLTTTRLYIYTCDTWRQLWHLKAYILVQISSQLHAEELKMSHSCMSTEKDIASLDLRWTSIRRNSYKYSTASVVLVWALHTYIFVT